MSVAGFQTSLSTSLEFRIPMEKGRQINGVELEEDSLAFSSVADGGSKICFWDLVRREEVNALNHEGNGASPQLKMKDSTCFFTQKRDRTVLFGCINKEASHKIDIAYKKAQFSLNSTRAMIYGANERIAQLILWDLERMKPVSVSQEKPPELRHFCSWISDIQPHFGITLQSSFEANVFALWDMRNLRTPAKEERFFLSEGELTDMAVLTTGKGPRIVTYTNRNHLEFREIDCLWHRPPERIWSELQHQAGVDISSSKGSDLNICRKYQRHKTSEIMTKLIVDIFDVKQYGISHPVVPKFTAKLPQSPRSQLKECFASDGEGIAYVNKGQEILLYKVKK